MHAQTEHIFWESDIKDWIEKFNSSENGLSDTEATRIAATIKTHIKARTGIKKDLFLLARQFKSPLMLLLIGAVIISGFLSDLSDVFIILFIVISTGLLSFFQERNAGKVVEKLQTLISTKSTVLRNDQAVELPSKQIVPGDVILLKAGDMLPADCRIIEANELYANESSLTGESYPARKEAGVLNADTPLAKRRNCLWEGSNIVSGKGKAFVIQTGPNTLFGKISLSASSKEETHFEKGIREFGFFLMKITLTLSLFILIVNIVNHESIIESALFSLSIAVGMAPELLPAIATITMGAGAKRLLEKKVIVKKLNAIQNLGEVTLLCTDKTGTITAGEIKITGIVDAWCNENEFVKQLAYWNAFFETGYSNPMDNAIKQLNLPVNNNVECIGEVPYDFIRKRLSVAIRESDKTILITKGAFSQILNICSKVHLSDGRIEDINPYILDIEDKCNMYGKKGLRVIGVCYKTIITQYISKEMETEMIFGGFILLHDPVKPDIKETIEALKSLHVDLKIITGDNKNVAEAIAGDIGIQNPVIMTGQEMIRSSPEAIKQQVKNTHIFSEVEPQQKEQIILALKESYTVAYMGDGINDVSAIHAADVGISVDNAVDVAKEAADLVLIEKKLDVLADGIIEGRKTFANTMKYLYINTGSTFGNMFSVAVASLTLPFLPMLPKQILITNFLTDFPFLTVATDNVDKEQIEKPGQWNLKLIRNYMLIFGIHSSLFDIITFIILYFILRVKESEFQTSWFIESVLTELFILFIIRTHKKFFISKPGRYLFIFSLLAIIITIALPYLPFAGNLGLKPLPLLILGIVITIILTYIISADMLKVWFFKRYKNT